MNGGTWSCKTEFKKNGQGSYPGIYLTDQKLLDARFLMKLDILLVFLQHNITYQQWNSLQILVYLHIL